MNWKITKLTQTAMNQSDRMTEITKTICQKLLVLESVAQDMKAVEDQGLLSGPEYDLFLARWGFDRTKLNYVLQALQIYRDVADVIDPGALTELDFTLPFENLDRNERRRLAAALKPCQPLTLKLIMEKKEKLFPLKCLSL
jgi:hypothetical protein